MTGFETMFFQRLSQSWANMALHELLGFLAPKMQESGSYSQLTEVLARKRELRIKLYVEPLVHGLAIEDLSRLALASVFARAGHHIDIVIADFTFPLTSAQMINTSQCIEQISVHLPRSSTTIRRNSDWLKTIAFPDFFSVLQGLDFLSVQVDGRYSGSVASAYAVALQSIDSVRLDTDIEIAPANQAEAAHRACAAMQISGRRPAVVLAVPGRCSFGSLRLEGSAIETFGRIMSITDELLLHYYRWLLPVHMRELESLGTFVTDQPLEAKKQLATLVAAWPTLDLDFGHEARAEFERKFSYHTFTDDDFLPVYVPIGSSLVDALQLSGLFRGRNEIRRLLTAGAVRLVNASNQRLVETTIVVEAMAIKIGKRRLVRLIPTTSGSE